MKTSLRNKGDSLINDKFPDYEVEKFKDDLCNFCKQIENFYKNLNSKSELKHKAYFRNYITIDKETYPDYCWYILGLKEWVEVDRAKDIKDISTKEIEAGKDDFCSE